MQPPFIRFAQSTNTYHISVGASVTDIQSVAQNAAPGATILFDAGTFTFKQQLLISRGDITLRGASEASTTIVIANTSDAGIEFNGRKFSWQVPMTTDVKAGSKSFTLPPGTTVQAGDVLELQMNNDASMLQYGPYDTVYNSPYWNDHPMRQSMVQVDHVSGNTVYLKEPLAYDMTASQTTLAKCNLLQNVHISDMTVTYNLGTPKDPAAFTDQLPAYAGDTAILATGTLGLDVHNLAINNAASSGLTINRALNPSVNNFSANGAFDKGSNKNGYALTIEETFYGNFDNLTMLNTRHSFLFSSWHAEVGNTVHILNMNRDVNYHGSPDHDNTVLVDYANYLVGVSSDGNRAAWGVVDDGGGLPNPPATISANTNLFKTAYGSFKDEVIYGWNGGAHLYGDEGNDTLYGGTGADVLSGGIGDDTIYGGAGNDPHLYGDDGDDLIHGGDGNDTAHGGTGNDILHGDAGDDTLSGDVGDDSVYGDDGNDTLWGNDGNDKLSGGTGNDVLHGGSGNDTLLGDTGTNTLYGESGNDILHVDGGTDTLYGGSGADKFVFDSLPPAAATIADFSLKDLDRIDVSALLTGYTPILSSIASFVKISVSGTDSVLYVDPDGSGGTGWKKIAVISGVTGLDPIALAASGTLILS